MNGNTSIQDAVAFCCSSSFFLRSWHLLQRLQVVYLSFMGLIPLDECTKTAMVNIALQHRKFGSTSSLQHMRPEAFMTQPHWRWSHHLDLLNHSTGTASAAVPFQLPTLRKDFTKKKWPMKNPCFGRFPKRGASRTWPVPSRVESLEVAKTGNERRFKMLRNIPCHL